MNLSSLVGHILEVFPLMLQSSGASDRVLDTFFRKRRYLGAKDRRFISENIYGLLRHTKLLKSYLLELSASTTLFPSLPPNPLLLYVVYSLRVLHNSIVQIIESVRPHWSRLSPEIDLPNLLRYLQHVNVPDSILSDPVRRNEICHSLPDFAVREWVARYGDEADELCACLNRPAPLSLRVNRLKTTVGECREALEREGVETSPGVHSPDALTLAKRTGLGGLRTFRRGWFEMQDEGSQILSFLVDPLPGSVVVDGCAGAGGKSLHLASLMSNEGEIHAFDVDEGRLRKAHERALRAGVTILTTHARGEGMTSLSTLSRSADRVLIDAPCSGSGVFRRNPAAKLNLKPFHVDKCIGQQRSLLSEYASMVKDGGRLVYATCSLLAGENEEIVNGFIETHPEFSIIPAESLLKQHGIQLGFSDRFLTLFPHRHGTDGFFAAVFQRGENG